MIIANFYFIKGASGLFYYGLDYLADKKSVIRMLLVRPGLEVFARSAMPGVRVVVCASVRDVWKIVRSASKAGDLLYTPSSHPLPFISRQWVVVHDVYPFLGMFGWVKKMLFALSMKTSGCMAAYFEENSLNFLQAVGVPAQRILYAPNKMPTAALVMAGRDRLRAGRLTVGLAGTDSTKKNYDELFAAVEAANLQAVLIFTVFGHHTPYIHDVTKRHPAIQLQIVESESVMLSEFLAQIDLLVSVAVLEGFGRPIAAAMLSGVPCYLMKRPVFLEYFPQAFLFDTVEALVQGLASGVDNDLPHPQAYVPPAKVVAGFHAATALLLRSATLEKQG